VLSTKVRKNFILYVLFYSARYVFPITVTPFYARTLGSAQFSKFVVWNACVWTSSLLVEFGFHLYAVNRIAACAGDSKRVHDTVASVVVGKLLLAPLALLVYAFAAVKLELGLVNTLLGALAMFVYGNSFAWYFQGLQRGSVAVALEAAPLLAQLVLIFSLVREPSDLSIACALQTGAALTTAGLSLLLLRADGVALRLRRSFAVRALRDAWPYFVERVCYTLYSTATPILLSALASEGAAAFYNVAEKVNVVIHGVTVSFLQAVLPSLAREQDDAGGTHKAKNAVMLSVAMSLLLAAIVYVAAEPAILLVFPEEYRAAVAPARVFGLCAVAMSYQLSLTTFYVIARGQPRILLVTGAAGLCVSAALQLALVPTYGALGSAIGRTATEVCIGAILTAYVFSRRLGSATKVAVS
jgi:O-antigen/teichoic acid export membrane protein